MAPVQPMTAFPSLVHSGQPRTVYRNPLAAESGHGAKLWDVHTSQAGSPGTTFSGKPLAELLSGKRLACRCKNGGKAEFDKSCSIPSFQKVMSHLSQSSMPSEHSTMRRLNLKRWYCSADCMSESFDRHNSITGSTAFRPSDLLPEHHAFVHGMLHCRHITARFPTCPY